jgi:hypothetical protein
MRYRIAPLLLAIVFFACDRPGPTASGAAAAEPLPTAPAPAAQPAAPPPPASPAAPAGPPPALVSLRVSPRDLEAGRPRVSPDGRTIAFHAGPADSRDIYVVDVNGENLRRLTNSPSDDCEPDWAADGARLVFSSNRNGTYDIFVLQLNGGAVRAVTSGAGDEREPTLSPLRYTFSAVFNDGCQRSGAGHAVADTYEKVVFTERDPAGQRSVVRFQSLNKAHAGDLSEPGAACFGPRFSRDGLSLAFSCATPAGAVVHDSGAVWDQSFAAALEAVRGGAAPDDPTASAGRAAPDGCAFIDVDEWRTDACLARLPRRYSAHHPNPVSAPAEGRRAEGYATNHTLVLSSGPAGAATRERRDEAAWEPLAVPGAAATAALDWSPCGRFVAVARLAADGQAAVFVEPTRYYLQDVKDLSAFPELWGRAQSERLGQNGFVVRPGADKEFFAAYDKVRYAQRGVFVTADAVLQVVRDELAALLQKAEKAAAEELAALVEGLMHEYAARPDEGANHHIATHFAVAFVALAAAAVFPPRDELFEPNYELGLPDEPPAPRPALSDGLAAALAEVPAVIRARTALWARQALAHEGFVEVTVPGLARPVPVDFSQMKPRGHYDSHLAGYFVAMKWLAMVPLAMDADAVALVRVLAQPRADGSTLLAHWQRVDALAGAFMGRPVDLTVSHVSAVLAEEPTAFAPFDPARARALLTAKLGEVPIRGLARALADDAGVEAPEPELVFSVFPLRLGLDVTFFSALTHSRVNGRRMPAAVDPMAVFGIPAALRIARQEAAAAPWREDYEAALAALGAKTPAPGAPLFATDLYHAWLALLRLLATPVATPATAGLAFAGTAAWEDRLLSAALAGYAQLKHDAVLYAFQDFSAECADDSTVYVFVEQPVLPAPRGFVEPHPEFLRAAAAFAALTYERLGEGSEPHVADPYEWERAADAPPRNARTFAERLARIAELQLARAPIPEEDLAWLREIGGELEALFFQEEPASVSAYGADQGRLERGVALVTDIHTNVTAQEALHIGIGRLDRIYVVVPDAVGSRMTEGAAFSFYETLHPIADRLTDEQWHERIERGALPPRPAWTASFFEEGPAE